MAYNLTSTTIQHETPLSAIYSSFTPEKYELAR